MRNHNLIIKKMTALLTLMLLVFASVTRVEAATTPTLTAQQIEAVVGEAYNGFARFDVQQVANQLTADSEVEVEIGFQPAPGIQTIIRKLDQQERIKRLREFFYLTYFWSS